MPHYPLSDVKIHICAKQYSVMGWIQLHGSPFTACINWCQFSQSTGMNVGWGSVLWCPVLRSNPQQIADTNPDKDTESKYTVVILIWPKGSRKHPGVLCSLTHKTKMTSSEHTASLVDSIISLIVLVYLQHDFYVGFRPPKIFFESFNFLSPVLLWDFLSMLILGLRSLRNFPLHGKVSYGILEIFQVGNFPWESLRIYGN